MVLLSLEDSSDQLDKYLHSLFLYHHNVGMSHFHLMHYTLLCYLQWDQVCQRHKRTSGLDHIHQCS